MTFSQDVKQLIMRNIIEEGPLETFVAAMIKTTGTLSIRNGQFHLLIENENPSIVKFIYKYLREQYEIAVELSVIETKRFKNRKRYVVRVLTNTISLLETLGIFNGIGFNEVPSTQLFSKDADYQKYLAGFFVVAGSINSPETSNYHVELRSHSQEHAQFIEILLSRFHIPAKTIERRAQFVTYFKSSEKISEFLVVCFAAQAALTFENMRLERDYVNSLNRISNCEIANEVKTQHAANNQVEAIKLIEAKLGLDVLDEKTRRVATLRVENDDASLMELCDLYYERFHESISKSGMNHKMRKIVALAKKITQ